MSRTDKDRPWWVVLNDTAHKYTDHDHLHFGRPVYRSVPRRDADGNHLTEPFEVQRTARDIVDSGAFAFYKDVHEATRRKIIQHAKERVGAGFPDEKITVYTWHRKAYDKVLVGYQASECTAGEKTTADDPYGRLLSCTPGWDPTDKWWHHKDGDWRHQYSQNYYRGQRRQTRDDMRLIANAYNSGLDPEDYEDRIDPLLSQHHHGVWWYLW